MGLSTSLLVFIEKGPYAHEVSEVLEILLELPKYEIHNLLLDRAGYVHLKDVRNMFVFVNAWNTEIPIEIPYEEIKGHTQISFSLGCDDQAVAIMNRISQELLGKFKCRCFLDENDCDEVDYQEVKLS